MKSAMALIESTSFDAATGMASDLDTVLKAATGAPLAEIMQAAEKPAGQLMLAKRILELVERDFDTRYLNPSDTAVAVYLWVLANTRRALAEGVAAAALGLRNGWWATRMSRRILSVERDAVPVTTAAWAVAPVTTRVDARSAPREELTIAALGIAQHLREAKALGIGSPVSSPSSQSITLNAGAREAFEFAGCADTVNDNLALAA
jgi:hypothetical protein